MQQLSKKNYFTRNVRAVRTAILLGSTLFFQSLLAQHTEPVTAVHPTDTTTSTAQPLSTNDFLLSVESYAANFVDAALTSVLDKTVAMPKNTIVIVIGMVIACSILILLIRRSRARRKRLARLKEKTDSRFYNAGEHSDSFENFVFTLFDPLYFKIKHVKRAMEYAGQYADGDLHPDVEVEFNFKGHKVNLAIEMIYYERVHERQIKIATAEQLTSYQHFADRQETYKIIGIGGTPDDPLELYVLSAKDIAREVMHYKALQPFRKWGMFFYSIQKNRLL